jgi:hypothetical protein
LFSQRGFLFLKRSSHIQFGLWAFFKQSQPRARKFASIE